MSSTGRSRESTIESVSSEALEASDEPGGSQSEIAKKTSSLSSDHASSSRKSSLAESDYEFAKRIEQSMNRAISARRRSQIEQTDAALAKRLAELGSLGAMPKSAKQAPEDIVSSKLSLNSGSQNQVSKKTKDDDNLARQLKSEYTAENPQESSSRKDKAAVMKKNSGGRTSSHEQIASKTGSGSKLAKPPSEKTHLDNTGKLDTDSADDSDTSNGQMVGVVSQAELQNIFAYVKQFKPESVELDPVMYPFLPDFIAAVGDVDALIKIPPPEYANEEAKPALKQTDATSSNSPGGEVPATAGSDTFFNDLGLAIVDEPATRQSDPAVLHYQLLSLLKAPGAGAAPLAAQSFASATSSNAGGGLKTESADPKSNQKAGSARSDLKRAAESPFAAAKTAAYKSPVQIPAVHKIAHGDARRLEEWISSTRSAEWTSRRVIDYVPLGDYPPIEDLMGAWEQEFDKEMSDELVDQALAPSADMLLEDYIRLVCFLVGIPIHESVSSAGGANKSAIEALNCLFELYHSFSANQHFGGADS